MTQVTGVVERAGSKTFKGNTFHNFSLVDDESLYRTGFKDFELKEGDQVTFEFEKSQYGNDVKTLEVTGNVPVNKAKTSAKKAAGNYSGSKGSRDDYWTQKAEDDKIRQRIISYQAANKTAVDIVKMALEQEAITLGSAKAKKLDALMAVVDEVTDQIFTKYQNAGVDVSEQQAAAEAAGDNSLDD